MTGRRRLMDVVARLPATRAALAYAESQHAGQPRTVDGAPFILHPIEVATLLYDAGAPDQVMAAGLLHDTIEKTSTDATDLQKRFGAHVATLVLAVTEDEDIEGYHARKAALRERAAEHGREGLMLLAADKISKARELRLNSAAGRAPARPVSPRSRKQKLTQYRRCAEFLEARLTDSPLVPQLRAEIDQLARPRVVRQVAAGAA